MKTISKKQFDNAVEKVLNGGKSCIVKARFFYPFSWTRNKGHMNLRGSIPANSKFVRNTGRGGKASDLYMICELANGYQIAETKAETAKRLKIEAAKKSEKSAKAKVKRLEEKRIFEEKAKKYGLTPKEYAAKLKELKSINSNLYEEYKNRVVEEFDAFEHKNEMFKIQYRVQFSRILSEKGIKYTPKKIEEIL